MPLTTFVGVPKTATSIQIPAANTPFNPDAVNPSICATWEQAKAMQLYGIFGSDFYLALPPYPSGSGPYVNSATVYLSGGIVLAGGGTHITFNSSRSFSRPIDDQPSRNVDSWWASSEQEATKPRPSWKQQYSPLAATPKRWLAWVFRLPRGATLTRIDVQFYAEAGSHLGGLPATMPKITLWKCTTSNSSLMTSITSVTDGSGTVGAYETPHDVTISTSYSVITDGDYFVLGVAGEEGADATAASAYTDLALIVYPPRITWTQTQLAEDGA